MPYITPTQRQMVDAGVPPADVGELTYKLYRTVIDYLDARPTRYAVHAEIVAALENTKEEYRRQELNPYEDDKIEQNGDI